MKGSTEYRSVSSRNARLRTLFIVLVLPGCINIYPHQRRNRQPIREFKTQDEIGSPRIRAKLQIDGSRLDIRAEHVQSCSETKHSVIRVERVNAPITDSKGQAILAAEWAGGLIGAAAGGILLGMAHTFSNEHSIDDESGKEQASDREMGYMVGGLLAAASVPLLIAAIANTVRVSDSTHRFPDETENIKLREFICSVRPAEGLRLTARLGEDVIPLGATNNDGKLAVSLKQIVPRHLITGDDPALELAVESDSLPLGSVDLTNYHRLVDKQAWASAKKTNSSKALQSYINEFPHGEYAEFAATVLDKRKEAQEKKKKAAEAAAARDADNRWQKLRNVVTDRLSRGDLRGARAAARNAKAEDLNADRILDLRAKLESLAKWCPAKRSRSYEALQQAAIPIVGSLRLDQLAASFFVKCSQVDAYDEFEGRRCRRRLRIARRLLKSNTLLLPGFDNVHVGRYDFRRYRFPVTVSGMLYAGTPPVPATSIKDGLLVASRSGWRRLKIPVAADSAEEWKSTHSAKLRADVLLRLGRTWTKTARERRNPLVELLRQQMMRQARRYRGVARRFLRAWSREMRKTELKRLGGVSYRAIGVRVYSEDTGEIFFSSPAAECKSVKLCSDSSECAEFMGTCHAGRCVPPWRRSSQTPAETALRSAIAGLPLHSPTTK